MNLQYLSDELGKKTAVVIPIEDWEKITKKFGDLEDFSNDFQEKKMSGKEFENWIDEAEATENLTLEEFQSLWKKKEKELKNLI